MFPAWAANAPNTRKAVTAARRSATQGMSDLASSMLAFTKDAEQPLAADGRSDAGSLRLTRPCQAQNVQIILGVLIGLVALGAQADESPFNTYRVFLDKGHLPGGCSTSDTRHFRNRAYSFRGGCTVIRRWYCATARHLN